MGAGLRWAAWCGVLAAVTLVLLALRTRLDNAHVSLVYLLLVLGGSATGGRSLGLTLAGAAFLLFNWFFLPPYGTLVVADPLDWLVLVAFLAVGAVAAQLLHRLEKEAEAARRRTEEVDRLALERVRLTAEADHAEALREADRLKDALLASVSHDLRTPLTTIKAHAHDLARYGDERAIAIEEEADRLNRLVADLLDLSGLRAGALPVRIELNAVDDLIGAVVQRVTGVLGGREIRITMANGGTLLVGRFDFVHTMRILVNLIENAHKYSPPAAPLDLAVEVEGDRLVFTVSDRGRGVAPEEREQIFEPFYRLPGVPPDIGGSGLGLAIARRLAKLQDGTLTYGARAGGGSCFRLTLPAADLPATEESL